MSPRDQIIEGGVPKPHDQGGLVAWAVGNNIVLRPRIKSSLPLFNRKEIDAFVEWYLGKTIQEIIDA